MKFTVSRSIAFNVLSQLLKTCDVKAKGKPDSEFLFEERKGLLFVTATNDKCQQTIKLDTTSFKAETDEKFS
ncbi:hypothetical protein, partial [Klebsiella pneumoniae]|uniref:hypothetical protein n=1 Tax=Klebsiella pneumoniae TaxID=573 RepID=UPI003854B1DA